MKVVLYCLGRGHWWHITYLSQNLLFIAHVELRAWLKFKQEMIWQCRIQLSRAEMVLQVSQGGLTPIWCPLGLSSLEQSIPMTLRGPGNERMWKEITVSWLAEAEMLPDLDREMYLKAPLTNNKIMIKRQSPWYCHQHFLLLTVLASEKRSWKYKWGRRDREGPVPFCFS